MKCSQCGKEEFKEEEYPIFAGFNSQYKKVDSYKIFKCLYCGHYEFFDRQLFDKKQNIENKK